MDEACETPQFWLLWAVLFLNVTAGIGMLEQASPMIQEMFRGGSTAAPPPGSSACSACSTWPGGSSGRSLSDRIGRKRTYAVFFTLGPLLYAPAALAGRIGSWCSSSPLRR